MLPEFSLLGLLHPGCTMLVVLRTNWMWSPLEDVAVAACMRDFKLIHNRWGLGCLKSGRNELHKFYIYMWIAETNHESNITGSGWSWKSLGSGQWNLNDQQPRECLARQVTVLYQSLSLKHLVAFHWRCWHGGLWGQREESDNIQQHWPQCSPPE
jgi:hypothetical protein